LRASKFPLSQFSHPTEELKVLAAKVYDTCEPLTITKMAQAKNKIRKLHQSRKEWTKHFLEHTEAVYTVLARLIELAKFVKSIAKEKHSISASKSQPSEDQENLIVSSPQDKHPQNKTPGQPLDNRSNNSNKSTKARLTQRSGRPCY